MKKEKFKTSIGGQALIEGIMMRGPAALCVAVRTPGGDIDIDTQPVAPHKWANIPIVRGVLSFIGSLTTGYRCLMRSAEISMSEEEKEEEKTKFDRWAEKHLSEKVMNSMMGLSAVLGGVLAIVLFMILPTFLQACSQAWCRWACSRRRSRA
ncbi:MAG: DUF1385 domain-containing protein [Pygmaiobacter sp.]